MRNLVLFLFTLPLIATFVILFSTSCNEPPKVQNYRVQTIDSCEYIVSAWDRSRSMTHKGNCKYCKIRNAKTDTIYIQSSK